MQSLDYMPRDTASASWASSSSSPAFPASAPTRPMPRAWRGLRPGSPSGCARPGWSMSRSSDRRPSGRDRHWTGAARARRRSWSTATTTCSRPIRWSAGQTPPFKPEVRDGRLYARGVSDDKGPMLIPLKVAEAYMATAGRLPVNLKFVIEGEEECGSAHLEEFVAAHARGVDRPISCSRPTAPCGGRTNPRSRSRAAASRPWSSRSSARSRTCIPGAMAAARPTRCRPFRGSRLAA